MDVLILAGGSCDEDLARATGVRYRAEIPFAGRRLVDVALEATEPFGEPILVGGPDGLRSRQVRAEGSFLASLAAGIEAVRTESFLLATSDMPFLNSEALGDFLARCDPEAGLCYPIVPLEECESRFPGLKRTTLMLREGRFTGGNVALLRKSLVRKALPTLERAYEARKSPLRLAGLVGWQTLLRVLVGKLSPNTLTLRTLERAVGAFLGMPVRAVVSHFAEIGTDVDDVAQYSALLALRIPDRPTDV